MAELAPPRRGEVEGTFIIGVYILKSEKDGSYYVGSSNDIERRFYDHNHGAGGKYSKIHSPWKIIWSKEFDSISKAREEEKRIKSFKGGNAFKKLLM